MTTQTLVLQGESELRLEVDFDKIVVVTVKEGIAEVLGLELAQGKEYAFAGAKVAIYTWFGARVEVVGETTSCYATGRGETCLLYTSPSPRDGLLSRMPSSA